MNEITIILCTAHTFLFSKAMSNILTMVTNAEFPGKRVVVLPPPVCNYSNFDEKKKQGAFIGLR